MTDRRTANVVAIVVFFFVLLTGLLLIVAKGPTFDPPETRKTVVESTAGREAGKETRSKVRSHEGRKTKSQSATRTRERPIRKPPKKSTVTVEEGSRSLVERALGESGLIGLQAALVVLASFLFAGLVQRVLMGDYAVKVGNLELGALQVQESSEATEKLTAQVADLQVVDKKLSEATDAQKQQLEVLSGAVKHAEGGSAALAEIVRSQAQELISLAAKLKAVEDKRTE